MWKILLVITIWQVSTATVISIENYDLPIWPILKNLHDGRQQMDVEEFYQNLFENIPSNRIYKYDNRDLFGTQSKRSFSLLARWKPFNNLGKTRSSIREHNSKLKTLLDQNVETRAHSRPSGQPLRWGKK